MNAVIAVLVSAVSIGVNAALAQSNPYCPADLTNDSALNFADVTAFLNLYALQDPAIDFDNSGSINFGDVSGFLAAYASCPDLTDTDGDRIPDFAETDNGVFIDILSTGTNPLSRDTDGDALDDGDEVLGTTQGLVLPNADPLRKDIYIECDWIEGVFEGRVEDYRPTQAVEARVAAAFANSGVENPYGGAPGITIHLDYGQGNGYDGGNRIDEPDFVVEIIDFDSGFNFYKSQYFDPRRKGYYHYAIFANRYNSPNNRSSGIAEINGDDFMVTMVDYNSTNNMANTLMHELGHNLGLRHGGRENKNYKPNYNSVMNYRHQFPGVDTNGDSFGDGALDYSRGENLTLSELSVFELNGVNGLVPIDWNRNGVIDEFVVYELNINCAFGPAPCGDDNDGDCYDSVCNTLQDFDDWSDINWGRLGNSFDRPLPAEHSSCDNWPGKH